MTNEELAAAEAAVTYAACVDNGVVVRVLCGTAAVCAECVGEGEWIDTPTKVGIGWTWDGAEFRPPKPYPSWTWDGIARVWRAPVPYPADGGAWRWNETTGQWEAAQ